MFEYPSEAYLLKTYDGDLQNGFRSVDEEEPADESTIKDSSANNENQPPPVPKRSKNSKLTSPPVSSSLKNNTIIGTLNGEY